MTSLRMTRKSALWRYSTSVMPVLAIDLTLGGLAFHMPREEFCEGKSLPLTPAFYLVITFTISFATLATSPEAALRIGWKSLEECPVSDMSWKRLRLGLSC